MALSASTPLRAPRRKLARCHPVHRMYLLRGPRRLRTRNRHARASKADSACGPPSEAVLRRATLLPGVGRAGRSEEVEQVQAS